MVPATVPPTEHDTGMATCGEVKETSATVLWSHSMLVLELVARAWVDDVSRMQYW